jgi:hypothetical protein
MKKKKNSNSDASNKNQLELDFQKKISESMKSNVIDFRKPTLQKIDPIFLLMMEQAKKLPW